MTAERKTFAEVTALMSAAADANSLKLHRIQFQIVSTKREICALMINA